MSAPSRYFHTVGKIHTFIIHFAVVLGGLISLFWFVGSLFLYCRLDRPVWELASLTAVSLFAFFLFCVRESSKRASRAGPGKSADEDIWDEGRDELEEHLAEIEEELSEARQKGTKAIIEKFEEAREDVLSQLKGLEVEDKVEELHRQRDEASAAGRVSEAREYSKKIDKHAARLSKHGGRLEDLPAVTRIFAYGMLTSFIFVVAFFILLVPLFMLLMTGFLWVWCNSDSDWLRSPERMVTLVFFSLILACFGVRVVSWHFSLEAKKTGKNLW
ncbi:MAG TPA: hypothetical protein DDW68_05370 [Verrucomicrobiales bacterium]|nr:hypothetical protein [Verrucomicrobiales bacterium]